MWNPRLYDDRHAFVWRHGAALIDLLAPQSGEVVLDLGCGTGHLTAQIAEAGATILGVDSSAEMTAEARRAYPALAFEVADARHLLYIGRFDAVFSNAVLHWVTDADLAAAGIARALSRAGGSWPSLAGVGTSGQSLPPCTPPPSKSAARSWGRPGTARASANTPPCWSGTGWRSRSPPCSTGRPRSTARTGCGGGWRCSAARSWLASRRAGGTSFWHGSRTPPGRTCTGTAGGWPITAAFE